MITTNRTKRLLAVAAFSIVALSTADAFAGQPVNMYSSDSDIKALVKEKLATDLNLGKGEFNVEVMNGVVSLTGFADSFKTKYQAERIARESAGHAKVENKLNVTYENEGGREGGSS